MKREMTNSITHLVKLVAAEVIEENIGIIAKRLKEGGHIVREEVYQINAEDFLNKITSNLQKAGKPWAKEEDSLLVTEVKIALRQIAANHQRSVGAITSRIDQKNLIRS